MFKTTYRQDGEIKEVRSLIDEIDSLKIQLDNIKHLGAMITSILDFDTILSVLMEASLEMVNGEVGGILINEEGNWVPKIAMGLQPEYIKSWEIKGKGNILDVLLSTKQVMRMDNPREALLIHSKKMNVESLMIAPVHSKGEIIGAVIIANRTDGLNFDDKDVSNLKMLVHFTAVAINNAKLLQLTLEKQQLDHELSVAKLVQSALLPSRKLTIPGVIIDASYIPAKEVGGDYYDVIIRDDKHFAVVVGDVTNKGVPAALMMSAARSLIRAEYRNGKDAASVINSINQLLCEDTERNSDMFITLFYAHIDLETKTMEYINGGHPPGFLIRKGEDNMEMLGTSGTIVGQFPEFQYSSKMIKIEEEDRIVLYTDGAFECFDSEGQMLGLNGLKKIVNEIKDYKSPMFLEEINELLKDYMVDKSKIDDFTMLVLDFKQIQ